MKDFGLPPKLRMVLQHIVIQDTNELKVFSCVSHVLEQFDSTNAEFSCPNWLTTPKSAITRCMKYADFQKQTEAERPMGGSWSNATFGEKGDRFFAG